MEVARGARGLDKQSKEYSLYLTYVIAIDFQTDAAKLWKRSRELYEREPNLFDPEVITKTSLSTLRSVVRSLGARYPNGAATGWKKISRILLDRRQGDPRNITPKPLKLSEVRARISEFPYLRGRKLNNFYIRAMGENQLFKIEDLDNLSVAVDIQVARITFYTGVIKADRDFCGCIHNEPIRPVIENAWYQATRGLGIPAWCVDEPLWSVGSKLCSKRACGRCPIRELCEQSFTVKFKGSNIYIK
jgi:endonuclease III